VKDISFHILDIVRNSIQAGAGRVEIHLSENTKEGITTLSIMDNGSGINEDEIIMVTDPFFTSSVKKKVGLGIPLLKQNVEQTGGSFIINSKKDKGTEVICRFISSHIDMIPEGDIALTIRALIASDPELDFIYKQTVNEEGFEINTVLIRNELDGEKLNRIEVLDYIENFIRQNINRIKMQGDGL